MEESIAEAEGIRSLFNEDEMEVCEILLNLGGNQVVESELRLRTTATVKAPFLVRWGTQKRLICRGGTRRGSSTTGLPPPPNNPATTATALSKPLSPLQSLPNNKIGQPEVKVVGSTSPDTPLSFSPNTSSESDDKSSRLKNSKKRVLLVEQLRKSVKELDESKEVLIKELENVKSYRDELLAYNKKLKSKKKQVLSTSAHHTTRAEPNLELSKSLNPGFNCAQSYQVLVSPKQSKINGEQLAVESTRPGLYPYYGSGQVQVRPNLFSSSTGLGEVKAVGPPDVSNLRAAAAAAAAAAAPSSEGTYGVASSQPLNYFRAFADNNRTKAAEARRNRKMINQQKSELRFKLKGIPRMTKPPLGRG